MQGFLTVWLRLGHIKTQWYQQSKEVEALTKLDENVSDYL